MSGQRKIQTIGVIGSGRMGTDIFLFLDGFGYTLRWMCKGEAEREAASACFLKRIARQKKTGMISEDAYIHKQNHTKISCEPAMLADCDLIIESIPENLKSKKEVFSVIARYLHHECILTSNSSSIRPSLLVPDGNMQKNFAGMHFFYPLAIKASAELIPAPHTSPETLDVLRGFLEVTGRIVFELSEANAFMLNRIFLPVQAEACRLAASGILEYQQIDTIVKKYIFPCGIFSFFDQVGIDIMLGSVNNYAAFEPDPCFLEPMQELLQAKVNEQLLGIKTGIGFYNYQNPDKAEIEINPADENVQICLGLLESSYKNAAMAMAEKTGTDTLKLNEALMEYTGAAKGPLTVNGDH